MKGASLLLGPLLLLPVILALPVHSRTLEPEEECLKYKGDWISVDRLRSSYLNDEGLITSSRWWGDKQLASALSGVSGSAYGFAYELVGSDEGRWFSRGIDRYFQTDDTRNYFAIDGGSCEPVPVEDSIDNGENGQIGDYLPVAFVEIGRAHV